MWCSLSPKDTSLIRTQLFDRNGCTIENKVLLHWKPGPTFLTWPGYSVYKSLSCLMLSCSCLRDTNFSSWGVGFVDLYTSQAQNVWVFCIIPNISLHYTWREWSSGNVLDKGDSCLLSAMLTADRVHHLWTACTWKVCICCHLRIICMFVFFIQPHPPQNGTSSQC